jgi:hypothetical protein
MKIAFIFLALGLIILWIIWSRVPMMIGTSTIDIHIHDTKVVIGFVHLALFLLLFLGTLFFVGGVIGTQFKRKGFTIPFVVFLLADIIVALEIKRVLHQIYN